MNGFGSRAAGLRHRTVTPAAPTGTMNPAAVARDIDAGQARRHKRPHLVAATTRHAGGMRVDHVMGLARLWEIPAGMPPGQGTYVRYDHELIGGVVCAEAARAHALAIGEDLGTVEPWLREFLAARRVLGTSMLWFERRADGTPRLPGGWRRGCLATVGTHDMPPAAAYVGRHRLAARAGLRLAAAGRPVVR